MFQVLEIHTSIIPIPVMKILIVEDEPASASNIVNYLSEQNYVCKLAPFFSDRKRSLINKVTVEK